MVCILQTEKPSAAKPPDGLGLFGDEDEDDLFGAVKPLVILFPLCSIANMNEQRQIYLLFILNVLVSCN